MNMYKLYYQSKYDVVRNTWSWQRVRASNRIEAIRVGRTRNIVAVRYGMIEETAQDAPKTPVDALPATVQVSWWQSGEREGEFSQQKYQVKRRFSDNFLIIEDALGREYGVPQERTRAA